MLLEIAVACTVHTCTPIAVDETPSHGVHCLQQEGWPQHGNALYAPWTAINACLAWHPEVTQNTAQLPAQPQQHTT